MTELIKLEQNITDTIKESQIKLGFTPNAVTLFYPLDSLNAITGGELTAEEMIKAIDEYKSEILSCKASLAQDSCYGIRGEREGYPRKGGGKPVSCGVYRRGKRRVFS